MKTYQAISGVLAVTAILAGASAQAFNGTLLFAQSLIAIGAIDASSAKARLAFTQTMLEKQINATNAYWKLGKQNRTLEKEAKLRAELKDLVSKASEKLGPEKQAAENGSYIEKKLVLPKIAEMETELHAIDTLIRERAYHAAQKRAIALSQEVRATQESL